MNLGSRPPALRARWRKDVSELPRCTVRLIWHTNTAAAPEEVLMKRPACADVRVGPPQSLDLEPRNGNAPFGVLIKDDGALHLCLRPGRVRQRCRHDLGPRPRLLHRTARRRWACRRCWARSPGASAVHVHLSQPLKPRFDLERARLWLVSLGLHLIGLTLKPLGPRRTRRPNDSRRPGQPCRAGMACSAAMEYVSHMDAACGNAPTTTIPGGP